MIRIGIIGLGWWGKQIAICLADSPRFKIVAGCDIDTSMAAPFAAEKKFDLVGDYKALLLRSDVDAVAIVTPHLLHEEMAVAAFAAGKHVFCEKPLALTAASAERIIAACKRPVAFSASVMNAASSPEWKRCVVCSRVAPWDGRCIWMQTSATTTSAKWIHRTGVATLAKRRRARGLLSAYTSETCLCLLRASRSA
jgi:Oxidoreductase family, NAD-binding Rossmann fold